MPVSVSSVNPPHGFAPPRPFQGSPPLGQVSRPNSPSRGTVWKRQTSLPVRTSNARGSPGAAGRASFVEQPTITRFSNTIGGDVGPYGVPSASPSNPARRSNAPLSPNDGSGFPSFASSEMIRPSDAPRITRRSPPGFPSDQNTTPRFTPPEARMNFRDGSA